MNKYKVEKSVCGDGSALDENIETSFYDTEDEAVHHIFEEAWKMLNELKNVQFFLDREPVLDKESGWAFIVDTTEDEEHLLYSWCFGAVNEV